MKMKNSHRCHFLGEEVIKTQYLEKIGFETRVYVEGEGWSTWDSKELKYLHLFENHPTIKFDIRFIYVEKS